MAKPWKTTGSYVSRRGDVISVPLDIEIDWQGIADKLAAQANSNKSGRSKMLGGLIVAKVRKVKK